MTPFDAFISHSSKDKAAAQAICATLENGGVRCWIAPRDILPGSEYGDSILEALDGCKLLVLVFSASANQSPHIIREVERVVSRNAPIVPIRIEDINPTKSLAYFVGAVHWFDALTPPFEQHLDGLADSVKAHLTLSAGRHSSPEPARDEMQGVALAVAKPQGAFAHRAPPHMQAMSAPAAAVPSGGRGKRWMWAAGAAVLLVAAVAGAVHFGGLPNAVARLFNPPTPPPPPSYFTDLVCNDKTDQSNIRAGVGSGYTVVARLQNRFHVKILDTVKTSGGYAWLKIAFLDTTGAYQEGYVDHLLVNENCDKLPAQ